MFVAEYCPNGWNCYNSYCYRKFTNQANLKNARRRCMWMESDLVSISDEQENDFVKRLLLVHSYILLHGNNSNIATINSNTTNLI